MAAGQVRRCVVVGQSDESIQRAVQDLEEIQFFGTVEVTRGDPSGWDKIASCEVLAMADADAEPLFWGWTGRYPWVLVWDSEREYSHIPADRILVVPSRRYPGDPRFVKHFTRMLEQVLSGEY